MTATTNPSRARPPTTPPPAALRRLYIEIPEGLGAYSDADVRLGIAEAWTKYLESLAGSAPPHIRTDRLRELAYPVLELLGRAEAADGRATEPI